MAPQHKSLADVLPSPVLVTGGAGFIGSHVVEALLRRGLEVRVLDDLSSGRLEHLPLHDPNLELRTGDVTNPTVAVAAARGMRSCIHLAAQAVGPTPDPYATLLGNILGAINVFEAARKHKVPHVLFASSGAVYGDALAPPFNEQTVPAPVAPRGMEKLVIEGYAELYHRRDRIRTLGLRYFNVYGPRQPAGPEAGAIPTFLRQLAARRPLQLRGDGYQTRDYIHVADAAEATVLALLSDAQGVLNVATGEATDARQLAGLVGVALGTQPLLHFNAPRPDEPRASWADIGLLRELGFAPARQLRTALGELAADLEAHEWVRERLPQGELPGFSSAPGDKIIQ